MAGYEGMRIHPGRHEVIFQLYDLEGNKVGSEVLLGDSNPLWLAHVASGYDDAALFSHHEGDSPDVHHLGQDRYLVTWR